MTTRGAKWMLIGVLMVSIGMHWALLQSIAWTGMLIRYSQEGRSVATALAMTFDGKHPCKLCRVTESGRRSGSPVNQVVPIQKIDLFAQDFPAVWTPEARLTSVALPSAATWEGRSSAPPVPPPRTA